MNSVFSIYLQDEIELTNSLALVLGIRFDDMDQMESVGRPAEGSPITNLKDSDDTISPMRV